MFLWLLNWEDKFVWDNVVFYIINKMYIEKIGLYV